MSRSWPDDARRTLAELIVKSLGGAPDDDPDALLSALDSIRLVELVVGVEAAFGVALTADVMTPETFSSTDGILAALGGCAARTYALEPPPADRSIIDALTRWASSRPDAPVLTWLSPAGERRVVTFAELNARSRALASGLAGQLELTGRRIGLLAANDVDTVVTIFALLRAGATCLLLNPADPPERQRAILSGHRVQAVLTTGSADIDGTAIRVTVPTTDAADWADRVPGPGQPAFMFGTSGSTAASKLVLQSHRAVVTNAEALRRHHGVDTGTKIMGGLPLHHANAVHFTMLTVYAGAHVVIPEQINALTYRTQLDEHQPTIASVVPTVLAALLTTARGWQPPRCLRYFVTAAAPLTTALANRVVAEFGVRAVQGYGLTETTNFSTTLPTDLSDEEYAALMLEAPIPSVGVAVYGNEVTVLTKTGEPAAEGEVGEVCMRGHSIMTGYADRADLTAAAFDGGWFHSGDLGYWVAGPGDRRFLHLTGRMKNMAKVGGEAVSLEELERALCSLDGVADAGCVAVPHAVLGEEIVAAVALRTGSVSALTEQLTTLVSPAALPRRWFELPEIPRTATGKLRRRELLGLLGIGGEN